VIWKNVWFVGYLPERDLGKVRYGQEATITTDCCPEKNIPAPIILPFFEAELYPEVGGDLRERVTMVYRLRIKSAQSPAEC